jgi:hypothetical protein
MTKSISAAIAILVMTALSGCNQAGGGIDIASVQNALKTACGFELIASTAAQTIASLTGLPGMTTAAAIADAICHQVNATTAHRGTVAGQADTVYVQGVPVTGRHVR